MIQGQLCFVAVADVSYQGEIQRKYGSKQIETMGQYYFSLLVKYVLSRQFSLLRPT
jgi:hypothetical protein